MLFVISMFALFLACQLVVNPPGDSQMFDGIGSSDSVTGQAGDTDDSRTCDDPGLPSPLARGRLMKGAWMLAVALG